MVLIVLLKGIILFVLVAFTEKYYLFLLKSINRVQLHNTTGLQRY